jgi:hypothetical protein
VALEDVDSGGGDRCGGGSRDRGELRGGLGSGDEQSRHADAPKTVGLPVPTVDGALLSRLLSADPFRVSPASYAAITATT